MSVARLFFSFVAAALLLTHTVAAQAQPAATPPELPTVPTQPEQKVCVPELVLASAIHAEMISVQLVDSFIVSRTVVGPVTGEDGVTRTGECTIDTIEQRPITAGLAIATVQVERLDGSEVSRETLLEELADETPVLLVMRGQELDARYLSAYRPETLVFRLTIPFYYSVPATPGLWDTAPVLQIESLPPTLAPSDTAPVLQESLPEDVTPRLNPADLTPLQDGF